MFLARNFHLRKMNALRRPTRTEGVLVANEADVVAVVNADGDRIAIWHVVLSLDPPMNRRRGAWTIFDLDL
jgi:hypothetical protein